MDSMQVNRLLVNGGGFLAINGALLAVTPGQFAAQRKMSWMPGRSKQGLDWLARNRSASRPLGIALCLLGVALLTVGLRRTKPVS